MEAYYTHVPNKYIDSAVERWNFVLYIDEAQIKEIVRFIVFLLSTGTS